MNCRTFVFIFSLLATLFGRSAYSCSQLPPSSFVEFSEDMDHVLVMLRGRSGRGHRTDGLQGLYRTPGLYRLDGSRDPVWTVDWFSSSVFPHVDDRYLVQLDDRTDWQSSSADRSDLSDADRKLYYEKPLEWAKKFRERRHAIAFYDRGELLHEYRLGDLFDAPEEIETVSMCLWLNWIADYAFNQNAKTFMLATTENISYTFSIVTGEIVTVEKYSKQKYSTVKDTARRERLSRRGGNLPDATVNALLDLVDTDWRTANALGQPYLSDYSLARQIISVHGATYGYFDKSLRDRRDLSLLAATSGDATSVGQLGKHSTDSKIALAGVRHDGKNYNSLPDDLKNNKRLLLRALRAGGMHTYSDAPENLRAEREVIVAALRAQILLFKAGRMNSPHFDIGTLGLIPSQYLSDDRVKHLIDAVIEIHSVGRGRGMAEEYRSEVYSRIRESSVR